MDALNNLNDVEAVCLVYSMYKMNKKQKKDKKNKRRWWVHPLNLKRPREGQFQVTFMTLRQYPEEFFKYFRMSIKTFDELLNMIGRQLQKQDTVLRLSIPPEERLTVTLR
ncbi:unnamed protein product [Macrosiphum euphorbiae]|uniref:Protein ANTAGONIST OF LIKE HETEROCHROMATIN PROTEIN 1-like n=1 Tax=Macrosiphum euphorbiae TaxID=13131 RepID=A0AAV0XYA9_9HEMI|nr:unnamed protein product [Macrosiphum euphorbiae]